MTRFLSGILCFGNISGYKDENVFDVPHGASPPVSTTDPAFHESRKRSIIRTAEYPPAKIKKRVLEEYIEELEAGEHTIISEPLVEDIRGIIGLSSDDPGNETAQCTHLEDTESIEGIETAFYGLLSNSCDPFLTTHSYNPGHELVTLLSPQPESQNPDIGSKTVDIVTSQRSRNTDLVAKINGYFECPEDNGIILEVRENDTLFDECLSETKVEPMKILMLLLHEFRCCYRDEVVTSERVTVRMILDLTTDPSERTYNNYQYTSMSIPTDIEITAPWLAEGAQKAIYKFFCKNKGIYRGILEEGRKAGVRRIHFVSPSSYYSFSINLGASKEKDALKFTCSNMLRYRKMYRLLFQVTRIRRFEISNAVISNTQALRKMCRCISGLYDHYPKTALPDGSLDSQDRIIHVKNIQSDLFDSFTKMVIENDMYVIYENPQHNDIVQLHKAKRVREVHFPNMKCHEDELKNVLSILEAYPGLVSIGLSVKSLCKIRDILFSWTTPGNEYNDSFMRFINDVYKRRSGRKLRIMKDKLRKVTCYLYNNKSTIETSLELYEMKFQESYRPDPSPLFHLKLDKLVIKEDFIDEYMIRALEKADRSSALLKCIKELHIVRVGSATQSNGDRVGDFISLFLSKASNPSVYLDGNYSIIVLDGSALCLNSLE